LCFVEDRSLFLSLSILTEAGMVSSFAQHSAVTEPTFLKNSHRAPYHFFCEVEGPLAWRVVPIPHVDSSNGVSFSVTDHTFRVAHVPLLFQRSPLSMLPALCRNSPSFDTLSFPICFFVPTRGRVWGVVVCRWVLGHIQRTNHPLIITFESLKAHPTLMGVQPNNSDLLLWPPLLLSGLSSLVP